MQVIRGLGQIKKFKKPVVAIGVFDGVHRGHRLILKSAAAKARNIKGTSVVLTFWPDPHRQQSLYSLEHRLKLIQGIGVDACIVLKFSRRLANLDARDFVKNILFRKIAANYIYVGRNFRFGRGGEGNVKTLGELSLAYNFKLKVFNVSKAGRRPVSSTCIRSLIQKGELAAAQKLLARPVSILGTVIKGASLAKKIGFPTANIDPHHEVIPPSGVYAVRVILDKRKLEGICNIGTRPTFRTTGERHIEAHIFDFHRDIYGKYLELQFVEKLRNEKKFASLPALAGQIKKDIRAALAVLSRH